MNSERILSFFKEITTIPRESGHEEQIIAYLQKFAAERNLVEKTDEAGNVLIVKEAAPGYENVPAITIFIPCVANSSDSKFKSLSSNLILT